MHQFYAVARLKDGVAVARASDEVRTIARRLGQQYPDMDSQFSANVVPLRVAAAFGLTRVIRSMLFGVAAVDGLTFAAVPLSLVGAALVASWLPARRAADVDPLVAMRAE